MPQKRNTVTLADDKDHYGLPIARVTCSWCDDDKRLASHSMDAMGQALEAINTRGGRRTTPAT